MSKAAPRFRRNNPALPVITTPLYEVSAIGAGEAGIFICNFAYLMLAGGQTSASESNIATSWANNAAAAFRACLSNLYTLTSVKVTCVSNNTRMPFTNTANANLGVGTVGFFPLPSTNAGIISKQTTVKGQHGRGRNYIPGIPTSFVTPAVAPDQLNAGALTAYTSLCVAVGLQVADGGTNGALCVYTRVKNGANVTNAAAVQTIFARPLIGTVRRRRAGRGK